MLVFEFSLFAAFIITICKQVDDLRVYQTKNPDADKAAAFPAYHHFRGGLIIKVRKADLLAGDRRSYRICKAVSVRQVDRNNHLAFAIVRLSVNDHCVFTFIVIQIVLSPFD